MKKVLLRFSTIVVILFLLSLYSWAVKHVTLNDKEMGFIKKPIEALADFPDLFEESVEEVQELPETFVKTPESLKPINKLENDVKVLTSYTNEKNGRTIELLNLRNGKSLHKWEMKNPHNAHARIMHPLLLKDKRIVYSFNNCDGLICKDSTGKVVWEQKTIPHHHSINLDADSNIWACTYDRNPPKGFVVYKGYYTLDGRKFGFVENMISLIDSKTGDILYHKSLSKILQENDLTYLLIQSANPGDPMHHNDIQPALKTTRYYEKGDIFMSLRNLSSIIHFRPSTGKVIRLIRGPFSTQHDVDFYNDSTLAFFNNNSHVYYEYPPKNWPVADSTFQVGEFYSNVTFYHFNSGEFSHPYDSIFKANKIYSHSEGVVEFTKDGAAFIEEQNHSLLWIIKDNDVIYHDVLPSHHEGHHHLANWARLIH